MPHNSVLLRAARVRGFEVEKKLYFKALVYTYLNKSLKKISKKERKYFGDSKTLCNFATANGKQRGSPLKVRKRKLKMPL